MNEKITVIKGIDFTTNRKDGVLQEIKDTVEFFEMTMSYIEENMVLFATSDNEFKLAIFEYESTVNGYEFYHGQEKVKKCDRILL